MTSDRRGSLLDFLRVIQLRPGMYTGAAAGDYGAHFDRLEMLISGYRQAVMVHGVQDEGTDLYAEFPHYVASKFGWNLREGLIATIRRESSSDATAWETFWRLLWELRDSHGAG
jgi:hypothetical protein